MKRNIYIAILILLAALIWYYSRHPLQATATVKGKTFFVEMAMTEKDRGKGLSGRFSMPENHCMLFVFDHKAQFPFNMYGMQFPLDFIWMAGNEIVETTINVPTEKDGVIPVIESKASIDRVLECNAGVINRYGIIPGDTVLFNK